MSKIEFIKYRDQLGNVYSVEKAARNGRWIVVRTNSGGNRKVAKGFPDMGKPGQMQDHLNTWARSRADIDAVGSKQ